MSHENEQARPPAGGAAYRRRHGLVTVTVNVTPEARERLHRAAQRQEPRLSLADWCARVLLEAAEKTLQS